MPKQEIDAAELFDLALSIVGVVLNEGDQSVTELSSRFDVSEKVILKAVNAITDSEDVKEYRTHFYLNFDELEDGWVSFSRENTELQGPPTLSRRQLASIAIGLDYLASLPQFSGNTHLNDLRDKLKSSEPVPVSSVNATRLSPILEQLHKAIENSVSVECEYRNQRGEKGHRRIDPLLIEIRGRHHYLRGWCHTNEEVRSFRLDRIIELSVTSDAISDQAKKASIPEEIFGNRMEEQVITISAEPEASEIFWNFPLAAEPEFKNGKYVGKIRVGGLDALPRHIVRYGGLVEVLEPAEARVAVANFARAALGEDYVAGDED